MGKVVGEEAHSRAGGDRNGERAVTPRGSRKGELGRQISTPLFVASAPMSSDTTELK